MKITKNKNKLFIVLGLIIMVLTSLVVGITMAKNMGKDESKTRLSLTRDYKLYKKKEYTYDEVKGKELYRSLCARCHLKTGAGTLQTPPLSGSNLVQNEPTKTLKVMVYGLTGKIERNGKTYNSIMPSFKTISHDDLSHILNYIRRNFGNNRTGNINPLEVIKMKVDHLSRKNSFTEPEL